MSIQYRFFCVPVSNAGDVEMEMNDFLRTVQVITVQRDMNCQENLRLAFRKASKGKQGKAEVLHWV